MANKKITDLTQDTSPSIDDLIVTVDTPATAPTTKYTTLEKIRDLFISGCAFLAGKTGGQTLIGGSGGLTLEAGGSNQNVTVTPSGSGIVRLNGNIGIGTDTPASELSINGGLHVGGDSDAGDNNALIDGKLSLGVASPTAVIHVKAGTATAGTGPFKLTSGTLLGTTEAGTFEFDGTHIYFTLVNTGTRYKLERQTGQLFLSASGGWPSTTSGCAANAKSELATYKQNVYSLDFDASTEEYAEWTVAMPSDWNAGTITAIFYWTHGATTTNFAVIWGLQGGSYGNDDSIDLAWGTAQEVTDTGGTTNDVYISGSTAAITLANTPAANEFVQLRVYRKAAAAGDTLAVDAKLLGVMVTYTLA
jgi:hypothetical protein